MHEVAPILDHVPELHDMHTELEVAPIIDDHVPALHDTHVTTLCTNELPIADDHVPALQATQIPLIS